MNKLLQINSVINSGSTGRIAEEIGQTAMASGWDSYIAFGRNDRNSQSHKIHIGNKWDVIRHGVESRLLDNHGFASRNATRLLINNIKDIKPDIVHLHNLHGYYLNVAILFHYLSQTDIPVIWTLHDCWPFTGHCAYFSFAGCNKWQTHCEHCPQSKTYPASLLVDRSYKNYELKQRLFTSVKNLTIVTVSDWLNEIVRNSFLKTYPVVTIHNGINTSVFSPSDKTEFRNKYNLQNKFIILGVASVWSPRKGLKDFIELSKVIGNEYQIVLVGLAPKQIKQLPNNIIGVEKTESVQKLAELYSAADIVLNISYEETFGMTTAEGFACGTPSIVYDTTASPELVDESTGLVVEHGNINGLIDAIASIKNNSKQFYRDACVKRARRLYRKEDRYQEYITLYEKLLNNSQRHEYETNK
jgi:glycosyltransferase involved in cell wall biosynthesis